jgi:hypothetical protein
MGYRLGPGKQSITQGYSTPKVCHEMACPTGEGLRKKNFSRMSAIRFRPMRRCKEYTPAYEIIQLGYTNKV